MENDNYNFSDEYCTVCSMVESLIGEAPEVFYLSHGKVLPIENYYAHAVIALVEETKLLGDDVYIVAELMGYDLLAPEHAAIVDSAYKIINMEV